MICEVYTIYFCIRGNFDPHKYLKDKNDFDPLAGNTHEESLEMKFWSTLLHFLFSFSIHFKYIWKWDPNQYIYPPESDVKSNFWSTFCSGQIYNCSISVNDSKDTMIENGSKNGASILLDIEFWTETLYLKPR